MKTKIRWVPVSERLHVEELDRILETGVICELATLDGETIYSYPNLGYTFIVKQRNSDKQWFQGREFS